MEPDWLDESALHVRDDCNMQVAAAPQKALTHVAGIRFDRNELSGAFGDIGTDFPLIVGLILAAHLDSASVLIVFGGMQILTGLLYRMPMLASRSKRWPCW
jgi:hypothetical protein